MYYDLSGQNTYSYIYPVDIPVNIPLYYFPKQSNDFYVKKHFYL